MSKLTRTSKAIIIYMIITIYKNLKYYRRLSHTY